METEVQRQIQELETKIRELKRVQVQELQEELTKAREVVAALEAEIASITGEKAPKATSAAALGAGPRRRKRTSSEEVRGRILKSLASAPEGLSQKEISEITGLNYNTVVIYLKNNAREFKTTGVMRSKRYFLK